MKARNGFRPVSMLLFAGAVLGTLVGLARTSLAQAPAAKPASQPGDVDLANSRVFTFVGATGFGHEHGVEGRLVSGNIQLGANQNAGELVFDMKSFDADTPAARKYVGLQGESDDSTRKQVNDNMLGADVLDVAKFPTAKFEIQSALPYRAAKSDSPPQYLLDGQFALHGVTKHLRVLAQTEESNGMIHVRTQFAVLQSQFGITPFSKLLGTIGVADKLTIYGDAWIQRAVKGDAVWRTADAKQVGALSETTTRQCLLERRFALFRKPSSDIRTTALAVVWRRFPSRQ